MEQDGKKKPKLLTENVKVECHVTSRYDNYRDWIPQIRKVIAIDNSTVTIDWLDGTSTSTWNFWRHKEKLVREAFPCRVVIKPIEFTASTRRKNFDINLARQDYLDVEYV